MGPTLAVVGQNGLTGEERRGAMWNVTIRGLRARKIRLLLTALAVLLGVSFVTGVFTFTDTLRASFERVFRATALEVDLVVRSEGIPGDDSAQRERMSDAIVEVVRRVPGVDAADGVVQGIAKLQGRDGEVIQSGLAPTVGLSWPTVEGVGPVRLIDDGVSREPRRSREVVIDATTASEHGFVVGDTIGVQVGSRPVEPHTIVGVFGFGDITNFAGVTFAAFELSAAQEGFDAIGSVDYVNVRRAPDASPVEVRDTIRSTLGFGVEVIDADAAADELGEPLREGLSFLERILLGFAAVGVFVGGFIIFNTFSILVSQRTRELGLLRSLGATNRQVVTAVIVEALLLSLVAVALGVLAGVALVHLLLTAFPDLGFEVPEGPTILRGRTVLVATVVGIGVTASAAIVPALRAARVSPIVAVGHDARALTVGSLARRSVFGVLVMIVGAGLVTIGLRRAVFTDIEAQVAAVALGCFAIFLGTVLVAPAISRILVPVLATGTTAVIAAVAGAIVAVGALVRTVQLAGDGRVAATVVTLLIGLAGAALVAALPTVRGVLAVLARGNAARNPRRTTATASALVLGLTLVCLVAIVASSIRHSLQSGIEEGIRADVVLSAEQFAPISPEGVAAAADAPGVDGHAQVSFGYASVEERTELVAGINPDGFDVVDLDLVAGSDQVAADGILVNSVDADRLDVAVGDPLTVVFSRLGGLTVSVVGIYENRGFTGSVLVDFIVSQELFIAGFGEAAPATLAFLRTTPDAADRTRAEIESLLGERYPDIRVQTIPEFQAEQDRSIDLIVNVLLALLLFSLVVALLGIVNTLFLSVYERTREIGLLRTVGMTPPQVRSMIRGEAMVIAVIGCLLGAAVGLLWGWAFARSLHDEGVTRFSIPITQLAVFVVVAAAAGVIASLWPAWRASHLDVLEAVAEE